MSYCPRLAISQAITQAITLTIMLAVCSFSLIASNTNAKADPPDQAAMLLLEEVAQHSANIVTLHAIFQQEKKLNILAQALTSQGYICVTRTPAGQGERLQWVYTNPVPSGFTYENGEGALWNASLADTQPTTSQEARGIAAIAKHILAWIRADAKELLQAYHLERPEKSLPILLLYPRQHTFFTKLEAVFTPSLNSLSQLTFFEDNGDTIRILFTETKINQALPEICSQ